MKRYVVYERFHNKRWFVKCLGDDKFTAEVLFRQMQSDWLSVPHLTDLILVEEYRA